MDQTELKNFVEQEFSNNTLPALMEFVKIPNLSKEFDP